MGTVAIIPARGGSKGLAGKNLLALGGLPLVGRAVLAALKAPSIDRVYVTSDDPEILKCAARYGAQTITRPDALSTDTCSSESALKHALESIQERHPLPEHFFFIQCTSPFLRADDLEKAVTLFRQSSADSLFSGTPFHHFIWQSNPEQNNLDGVNHAKSERLRRQDRPTEFLENGAFYLMNTQGFLTHRHRFFGTTVCCPMPASRSLEIDAAEDFAAAQALLPLIDDTALPNLLRDKKALVSDFDGVLTDNTVHLDETGRETVRLSRGDGMGLSALRRSGVPVLVLSSEQNPVVQLRCEKLGIPAIQTKEAKGPVLQQWALEQGLSAEDVVYIGNDLNDLPAFACAGVALAVADAHPKVLVAADYIIPHSGGCGAVRAVCDAMLKKRENP